MVTVAELEARLEALKAQRDRAVARVSCDGRSVEYRGRDRLPRRMADDPALTPSEVGASLRLFPFISTATFEDRRYASEPAPAVSV
jgi:hypothetical protein